MSMLRGWTETKYEEARTRHPYPLDEMHRTEQVCSERGQRTALNSPAPLEAQPTWFHAWEEGTDESTKLFQTEAGSFFPPHSTAPLGLRLPQKGQTPQLARENSYRPSWEPVFPEHLLWPKALLSMTLRGTQVLLQNMPFGIDFKLFINK